MIPRRDISLAEILERAPEVGGRSKRLYGLDDDHYLVKLVPTLSSFTHARHEVVHGTAELRLDFYELAARVVEAAGVPTAFVERAGPTTYVALRCSNPPFETIVKNAAVGSTLRKYPGLFPPGHRFARPVVKFDFRVDPEDQPIADDYLCEAGLEPARLKSLALHANDALRRWLEPRELLDFCLTVGTRDGEYVVTSEISPDGMRLRDERGEPLDKDIFRRGGSAEEILARWSGLVAELRAGARAAVS
ncbi:MAG TPA: phosphoribosylaminoimidazolesuccinocarboxamide synthase [Gaiellaceae bacterium]|jgi:phosphoribosylaminoimidazole-succinocarboxamide synthase|nr:phosphoribosylaminoimidazolesuccinocarboxamide synthase [Gaiellaceae bacterium]